MDSGGGTVQSEQYSVGGTRFTVGCEQYNVDITVRTVQSLQYSVNSTRWTV